MIMRVPSEAPPNLPKQARGLARVQENGTVCPPADYLAVSPILLDRHLGNVEDHHLLVEMPEEPPEWPFVRPIHAEDEPDRLRFNRRNP